MTLINNGYRLGSSSIRLLNEPIKLYFSGLRFKRFSPFYGEFNEKLGQMISSGLTSKWYEEYLNPFNRMVSVDDIGPQVLTMHDLDVAFGVCFIPLVCSVVAFAFERAKFWYRNSRKRSPPRNF